MGVAAGEGIFFQIIDQSGQYGGAAVNSGVINAVGSGVNESPVVINAQQAAAVADAGFMEGATNRVINKSVSQFALSPLNQVTGGLATPVYRLGKAVASGASGAAVGAGVAAVAIAVAMLLYQAADKQIKENKAKAADLNERDNVLIRSGAVSQSSNYQGNLWGVRKTNRS